MSKADELLRRALEAWDDNEPNDFNDRMEEIRAYLAAEKEAEPVAWQSLTDEELREIEKEFHAERVRTSDEEYLVIYPADYWDWQRTLEQTLKEKNRPPKPAEPEAETIETLKAENFKLASGQCTEGGPWGDEGGTPYCKYAKLERHNDD